MLQRSMETADSQATHHANNRSSGQSINQATSNQSVEDAIHTQGGNPSLLNRHATKNKQPRVRWISCKTKAISSVKATTPYNPNTSYRCCSAPTSPQLPQGPHWTALYVLALAHMWPIFTHPQPAPSSHAMSYFELLRLTLWAKGSHNIAV